MKTKLKPGIAASKTIETSWEGLPGKILIFPVTLALSGEMASQREKTIGVAQKDRAELLLDFRVSLLSDILEDVPKMIDLEQANLALRDKKAKVYTAHIENNLPPEQKDNEKIERVKQEAKMLRDETGLTEQELEPLYENFPGWDEADGDNLKERVFNYFNQKDKRGRQVFQFVTEMVINEFWAWATPRPTISVSAFLQN